MIRKLKFEYQIVIIYLLLGGLWILFSDKLIHAFINDTDILTQAQTYKGWFYVAITAIIFYVYLKKHLIKIRNAEFKAKESDKLKTAFLQNISHEIRTPMNGIIGFAQLLNRDNLTEQQKQTYVNIIISSSNQLLNIVNDVLDISLIESGNITANLESVNLNSMLDELYQSFSPSVKQNVTFKVVKELPNNKCIIITDKTKLRQVLNNLTNNAIKFTKNGHITVGYALKGDEIEFYVQDSGIGIEPILQEKIFDRFTQAEVEITRQYGGTGLGLAICKGNAKLLNGRIWVCSEIAKGATFYLSIPYNAIEDKVTINPSDSSFESLNPNKTILVAEDEEFNYLFIKELLKNIQVQTLYARNGVQAVEICRQNSDIDLVLMDIKMPIMNGFEAAQEIFKFRPSIKIIAQTAFAMAEDKERALSLGFIDYISKPFNEQQLISLIEKHTS
ncbi:MAG TPA: ATP-binding protein [Tenuifilaceae bacterium]|nr:ATP-binding protein [Tenuifilaceae bacterium]HPI44242.1 ATP-binding protein [Tenuifilaceae bacterium]HPN20915.1 ATP-binding protein [Tenuifilaceae bacterium]